jgi:hypothetical protein
VTSEERLSDVFDDLEGQAEALYAAELEAEVTDRSRAAYAEVTLSGRLMASVGARVALEATGAGLLRGELRRVATGWCLLAADNDEWLVPFGSIVVAYGLSPRSVPEVAWPAVARLGLASPLRRLADDAAPCVVVTRAGARHEVVLRRVGADFVEADTVSDHRRSLVLTVASVGAIQCRADRPAPGPTLAGAQPRA